MTQGTDETTLDGFSMTTIKNIIRKMKDQSFDFTRSKRIKIPKDKVVQEVIRMILECIYDGDNPSFLDTSHGFR